MKPCWYCNSDGTPCQACDERQDLCADLSAAADQIERMQAEIERLQAANDLLKLPNGHWHVEVTDGDITVTQLAEVQIGTRLWTT